MPVAVDQALPGLETRLQAPTVGRACDPAGPLQAPGEGRGGADLAGERVRALRQCGGGERRQLNPAGRAAAGGVRRQQRRGQLAIKQRRNRRLEAGRDL